MTFGLGVDLGTTFTAAAVSRGARPEMVTLGDRSPAIPSVVMIRENGTLDRRRRRTTPGGRPSGAGGARGEASPRRPHPAHPRWRAALRRTDPVAPPACRCGRGSRARGSPAGRDRPDPSRELGSVQARALRLGAPAGGPDRRLHGHRTRGRRRALRVQRAGRHGSVVAVYDLGGGTFDATVLRQRDDGFEFLGPPEGIEGLGGIDFDEAVFAHVDRSLDGALSELDLDDPRAAASLVRVRQDCVLAKEALSGDTETSIPVMLPDLHTEVRLTRGEFEEMIRAPIEATVSALRRALSAADVAPEDLSNVLLVGGSSRIPLVSQMLSAELGRPTAVDTHPKHAVALGAALLAGRRRVAATAAGRARARDAGPAARRPAGGPAAGASGPDAGTSWRRASPGTRSADTCRSSRPPSRTAPPWCPRPASGRPPRRGRRAPPGAFRWSARRREVRVGGAVVGGPSSGGVRRPGGPSSNGPSSGGPSSPGRGSRASPPAVHPRGSPRDAPALGQHADRRRPRRPSVRYRPAPGRRPGTAVTAGPPGATRARCRRPRGTAPPPLGRRRPPRRPRPAAVGIRIGVICGAVALVLAGGGVATAAALTGHSRRSLGPAALGLRVAADHHAAARGAEPCARRAGASAAGVERGSQHTTTYHPPTTSRSRTPGRTTRGPAAATDVSDHRAGPVAADHAQKSRWIGVRASSEKGCLALNGDAHHRPAPRRSIDVPPHRQLRPPRGSRRVRHPLPRRPREARGEAPRCALLQLGRLRDPRRLEAGHALVAVLDWDSKESAQASLGSAEGEAAVGDLANFAQAGVDMEFQEIRAEV